MTNKNASLPAASAPAAGAAVPSLVDAPIAATAHPTRLSQPASELRSEVMAALLVSGRRAPERPSLMPALLAYWRYLARSSAADRLGLLEELQTQVRAGNATTRAWVGVALGETDFSIVHDAVLGYVAAVPVSVETRDQHWTDALDWLRRGLALNKAAVFAALLSLQDETLLEQLGGLRSRLELVEAEQVWAASARLSEPATRDFISEWQRRLA